MAVYGEYLADLNMVALLVTKGHGTEDPVPAGAAQLISTTGVKST
jgi:hypothetical protein